jgi:hypothetical protein
MVFPFSNLIVATGGGGQTGLDVISFTNVAGNKARYYGPVFIGWIFIGRIPELTDCRVYSPCPYQGTSLLQKDASRVSPTS